MALLLCAEAKGLFLQTCQDLATPARTRGDSAKQPLLPSEKEARGSYKKPGEPLMAFLLCAEAKGLFLQPCRDPATLAHTRGGSAKQTLLPSEKEARGSFKKPEELLTTLLLRAEARELLLQKMPRPRDLGSHPRGPRQTDPHA